MSNSSIRLIYRILSGTTTLGQSGPGSEGNEGALRIPQSSIITGASLSDCLMSYLGHLLGGFYSFADMQSVYYTALGVIYLDKEKKLALTNTVWDLMLNPKPPN